MPNTKSQKKSNKSVAKKKSVSIAVKIRKLTVSYKQVEKDRLTFGTWKNAKRVPYLKLSGQWMEDAGFAISNKVHVIVRNNLLIIENAQE